MPEPRTSSILGPIFVLLLVLLIGCDDVDKTTSTDPQPVTSSAPATPTTPAPATIPQEQIELFDGSMARSNERILTGDLRPLWIVSGRIRNYSGEDLAHLRLQVHIFERRNEGNGTLRDEANLDLETDIPAGGVGSFSRQVQLLPPPKAWDWDWVVVEARTKTR
jgi:hypothetical protein